MFFFKIGHFALLLLVSGALGIGVVKLGMWFGKNEIDPTVMLLSGLAELAVIAYGIGWYQKLHRQGPH